MRRATRRGMMIAISATLTIAMVYAGAFSAHASGGRTQRIGIPAYWAPGVPEGAALFDRLGHASPILDTLIINGPNSAAPVPFDPVTASTIRKLGREGVTVLGYVDTGYLGTTGLTTTRVNPGSTTLADWQAQIAGDVDDWYELYRAYGLDGIFFDQVLSTCGVDHEFRDRYLAASDHVRRHHWGAVIAINPGTDTQECYTDVADVIVIFENTYDVYRQWTPPAWVHDHPASTFWHLVHGTPTVADMRHAIALSRQHNAGYVYVTDSTISGDGAPWHRLPPDRYWYEELRQVAKRWRA